MNFDKLMTDKQKAAFHKRVDKRSDDECWPWTGAANGQKRGEFWTSATERHVAPRVAWSLHNGEDIPDSLFCLHTCDNYNCTNPAHLWLGTQKDNMQDAAQKGRMARGTRRPEAKLNDLVVTLARHAYSNGLMGTVEIAKKLGVSHPTISAAVTGKTWKHVPMPEEIRA